MAVSIDTHPFHGLASSLPIADRASLIGLSDGDVRAWSAAKADEYRRFALALLSIYNAVAPIHRLPIEILSNTFERCWTDRKSLRVGHVCRRWRSILLNTSGFWADAVKREKFTHNDHPTGYLGVVLERSAPRVVAPSFHRFPVDISALAPHTDRFGSLVVSLANDSELLALWSCLNSGMHSLEALTIDLIDNPSWTRGPKPTLSPSAVPRLTRVTAPGCLMHCFPVPSLKHITLKNSKGKYLHHDRAETYEHLRKLLEVCAASLETLVLVGVVPSRNYEGAPLSLPALRHLRMQDDASHCALTLARLMLPDTTCIECINTSNGRLCDTVPLDAPMIQSRLRATDYVTIVNAPEATIVRCCAGTKGSLFIGLAGAQRPALRPDDLVQLLCHTVPVTGHGIGFMDERDSRGVDFRAFPHLVCLSIIGCGAEHILRNLARRDEDSAESPSGRAVCPELKKLIVHFEFEVEEKAEGLQLGPAVKEEHESTIEGDFRERWAELERILSRRAEMGTRVTGLEFGYTERTQPGSEESEAGHIWTRPTNLSNVWRTCGPILEPLRKLVDGPVVVQDYGDDW